MGSSTENSAFGADAQPARRFARARRVEWRIGGGGRGRLRAARARFRHRRIDPSARGVVRRRRDEADVRRGVALRPGRVRVVPRPDRAVRDHRRRRRAAARDDLGPRPVRLDVDRVRVALCDRAAGRGCVGPAGRHRVGDDRRRRHRARGAGAVERAATALEAGGAKRRSGLGAVEPVRPVGLLPDRARRKRRRTSRVTTACATACASTATTSPP